MDQSRKVNRSWEGCQRHTRSVEGGGNKQRPSEKGSRVMSLEKLEGLGGL